MAPELKVEDSLSSSAAIKQAMAEEEMSEVVRPWKIGRGCGNICPRVLAGWTKLIWGTRILVIVLTSQGC